MRPKHINVLLSSGAWRTLGLCGLVASLFGATPSWAQTASQVTPPSFRPNQNKVGGSLIFSGEPGLGTPAGAERLSVRLSGVTIENLPPDFAGEARAIQDRLVGRRIPASEIFAAARELEAAFVRTGAILVRVVLPAQTLKDGNRLRLVVVNGFVERIDTSRLPEATRNRIGAVIAPLLGRRDLQLGEIERRLLLAGDTPGVALRSTLSPSGSAGGTTLIIEGAYRPVTGYFGGDNTVGRALGGFSIGGGFDANTVFGQGETLYVRTLGNPSGDRAGGIGGLFGDDPTLRTLSGGFILPLGIDGLSLNIEATNSRTAPKSRNLVQTTSDYDRLSFRLRYPVLRSRTANVFTEVAFDATREKLGLALPGVIAPLSLDELRIVRLSADGDLRVSSGGLFAARGTASFGIDGLGARSRADATPLLPLSRLGADAEFQKVDVSVSFSQPLAESLVLGLYARGQTSFGQTLARSEQIGTASFQELSTFDAGSLGGDSGWLVRTELASPFTVTPEGVPVSIAPYIFGVTGALYLERPTVIEVGTLHVSSLGLGVRLGAPLGPDGPQASLTLEFGRRFRDDSHSGFEPLHRAGLDSLLIFRSSVVRAAAPQRTLMTRTFNRLIPTLLAGTALTAPLLASAGELPTGASVVHGTVGIAMPGANALAIQQSSQTAIVNWQTFSIGQGARVDVTQPNASSALLSRVTDSTPSTIAGQLNANGQVYLVNPNGIVITNSGVVRAGAFVGSTLGISDEDFKAGRRVFKGNGASATVSNQGSIDIAQGGFAALLGGRVENSGVVSVPLGRVGLGAGEQATLDLSGDGFLQVAVPSRADGSDVALITHSGRISAAGGRVEMQAATARDMARNAINLSGLVEARSVSGRSGAIVLGGGEGGTVTVSGRLNASAPTRQARAASRAAKVARGGDITITGDAIQLNGARLSANGAAGGGRIRIGGAFQGGDSLQRASVTRVDAATTISADAGASGRGGDVVVWSDRNTQFAGTISARGGASMGDGGSAEVSSKGLLAYTGTADLSAARGAFGTLLLDPYNVFITTGTDSGATQGGGTFTANANDSVINATTLSNALATANVTVTTGNAGGQAGDIAVQASVAWNAPTSLTLSAARNITVGPLDTSSPPPSIVVPSGGGLVLRADNTGNGTGTVTLAPNAIVATDPAAVSIYYNPANNPAGSGVNPTSYTNPTTYTATEVDAVGVVTGTGAVASYMLVNTAADLQNIRNNLTGNYAQGRDIDAAGASAFNAGTGFAPLGTINAETTFSGTYDGLGRTISGLTINRPSSDGVGLFGDAFAARLTNINLAGAVISGQNYVGGVVGRAAATVIDTVSNTPTFGSTSVVGSVTGNSFVGGIAGELNGTIDRSYARVAVVGNPNAAGVSSSVGGLVGNLTDDSETLSQIRQSYATGSVRGISAVGGLVGTIDGGAVSDSYASGAVSGIASVGGLAGALVNQSNIDSSYATGFVPPVASATGVGGLVGTADALSAVRTSYWDTQTSGRTTSAGGTGQTTAQLQGSLPAGFAGATWGTQTGAYPFLNWRFPTGVLAVSGLVLGASDPATPSPGTGVTLQTGTGRSTTLSGANGYYYDALAPLTGAGPKAVAGIVSTGPGVNGAGGALVDAPTGAGAATMNLRFGRAVLTTASTSTTEINQRLLSTGIPGGLATFAQSIRAQTGADSPVYIELVNPAGFTADQSISVPGALRIAGAGSTTSAGPIAIAANATLQSLTQDVVVATTRFTNAAGATGVQAGPGARWLVYSTDYEADQRGGLTGGNLYNRSFSANPPASIAETGNQFIFSRQPVLTVSATDAAREYGPTTLGATRTVTGLVNGDTAAQAYTGTQSVTDTTAATTGVGTYANAARIGQGTLASSIGYAFNFVDAPVTITPAPLTITANDATKAFGSTLTFAGTEFTTTGLRNADQVTRVSLTSDGAPATAPVAGSPYAIVASNAGGTGLVGGATAEGSPGVSNYRVVYAPGALTVTPPTPLDQATAAPTLDRQLSNTFLPVVPRTDTLDIANIEGGGPSQGVAEAAGAKGATLAYLNAASAELDAAMAACERQDQRRVKAYSECVGSALDTYAGKLELRLAQLPPAFRNIPAVVRQAAQKIRAARTITEARQAVRVAVVAVRKAIALIRADEPAVAQRQKREGNAIASALQAVDGRLSRSVGL